MSVAGTYAEALYGAAADKGAVAEVAGDLAGFRDALDESEELARTLANPEIETTRKRAVVAELGKGATPLVARFLEVLVDRGRIAEIPEIADAFAARVAQAEGRLSVEAVTAVPLTDELRSAIVNKVQADTGRQVALVESVDPDLVGGLVLRVGGYVLDGSLRSRLTALRATLTRAPVDAAAAAVEN